MEYLKLIEIAGGFVAKLLGLKKDRKIEVAGYLDRIAETLAEFPARIRAGAEYEELAGLSKQASEYASKFGAAGEISPGVLVQVDQCVSPGRARPVLSAYFGMPCTGSLQSLWPVLPPIAISWIT